LPGQQPLEVVGAALFNVLDVPLHGQAAALLKLGHQHAQHLYEKLPGGRNIEADAQRALQRGEPLCLQ